MIMRWNDPGVREGQATLLDGQVRSLRAGRTAEQRPKGYEGSSHAKLWGQGNRTA